MSKPAEKISPFKAGGETLVERQCADCNKEFVIAQSCTVDLCVPCAEERAIDCLAGNEEYF